MIKARGLRFSRNGHIILNRVDLDVPDGMTFGLVGPNGCGKTTLLRLLYGACPPDQGEIRLDGTNIAKLKRNQLARRVAVVPQERL